MDNENVKDNIFKQRRASGYTQTAMAEKIGLSRTAYRNIEMGKTRMISDKLEVIASSLNTTPEELLLGYQPSESDTRKLKDMTERYQNEKQDIVARYETEIQALKKQIEILEERVEGQKDTIRTKDEIIAMLKKKR